ncbi:MAG: ParB/RepB/Spo0J family partition protein [Pirellulaceae bacterium]
MRKDRRLGRGLAALLGTPEPQQAAVPEKAKATKKKTTAAAADSHPAAAGSNDRTSLLLLDVYEIDNNPFQPRREFSESELASLAESLKEHDMLQPVLVRRVDDRYQLISGERRLRAAIKAGWKQVPARIRGADDRLVAELAIVENLQRKDLNAVEKALSFRRYLEEHKCTQEDLAARLKIDRSTIANLMRLLELPDTVLDALRSDKISAGHARALLPLGDEDQQAKFCQRICRDGLSVRATEESVQACILEEDGTGLATPKKKPRRSGNDQLAQLAQTFRRVLGTKVDLRQTNQGRGRIVIHFANHDEFERLRDHICQPGADESQRKAA